MMSHRHLTHKKWPLGMLAALLVCLSLTAMERTADITNPPPLYGTADLSTEILDRHGNLLRPFANLHGRWRLAIDLDRTDPRFIELLLAYEDRRFWKHNGVDWLALARASWQFASSGHIVSGGSTITMQLARLLEPQPRTMKAKLHQMWRALQIERRISKRQILTRYLNHAPYGGNLEGLRAASLAYFGRGVGHLPPADAALLVALPQSPEARRPDRHARNAEAARNRVLDRAEAAGILSAYEAEGARARKVKSGRRAFPSLAAHETARAAATAKVGAALKTHLDAKMQSSLEVLARSHTANLGGKSSVALIVAEHGSGRVLARLGSPKPFDQSRLGPIDMTRAVRSPGSALKPFIYGLAFEAGIAHPQTLIDDKPTNFSGYAPKNFDNEFKGTVTMKEALSLSLNIPAVKVLEAVGPIKFLSRMARAQSPLKLPGDGAPGLAVALGGAGVSLEGIVSAYSALARGGEAVRLHSVGDAPDIANTGPIMGQIASWYVTDILTSTAPPDAALKGRIAYKTGTSYGYRDAWAVGYDGKYVIGVWVGRPDGTPIAGITGRTTAGPLLFEAFSRLGENVTPFPGAPRGALIASAAELPEPMRRFGAGGLPQTAQAMAEPLSIAFPPQGAHLIYGEEDALALKAAGGRLPLSWFANGRPVPASARHRNTLWDPDGRGFSRLSVIDAEGQAARVTVFLE